MDVGEWLQGRNQYSRKLRNSGSRRFYQRSRSPMDPCRLERHPWKPLALWRTGLRCHRKWRTRRPLGVHPRYHSRRGKPSDHCVESVDLDQGPQRGQPARHLWLPADPRVWPHVTNNPGTRWGPAYWTTTHAQNGQEQTFWMFGGEGFDATGSNGNGFRLLNDLWRYLPYP